MRPRLLLLRRTLARKAQSPPSLILSSSSSLRTYTQRSAQSASARSPSPPGVRRRPQNPYLSVSNTSLSRVRHMTTERKAQLKHEIKAGLKFTFGLYLGVGIVMVCGYFLNQESLEKQFPTPPEWTFLTRRAFRHACAERYLSDPEQPIQWGRIIKWMTEVQGRLTHPDIDGAGVLELPPDQPILARDISAKSETWKRGYFESWMIMAKALEQVDGWMLDLKRDLIFPPDMVIGPSNPNPRPIPAGFKGAPKEEDCTPAFKVNPNDIYLGILYTVGLSNKQRMEAGLAYASWLDYKGMEGPANIIYEETLNLAASETSPNTVNTTNWTLNVNENAPLPSENLLTTLTAYAEFRGRNNDIDSALPIFISLLKARRNLPEDTSPPPRRRNKGMVYIAKDLLIPRAYPPPPPDGTGTPVRDPKELCAEAALSLHIGEIIYTSKPSSREEGLSWTREAVDIAEEQLHNLNPENDEHKPARVYCRECLAAGLSNWQSMVSRLAKEEAAKKAEAEAAAANGKKDSSSWFGLWGGKENKEDLSRWAAEEKVIEERGRRAKDLLDDLEAPPKNPFAVLLNA